MKYEEAIEFQNLLKRLRRCIQGTLWKPSTAKYWHNRLKNTYKLHQSVVRGTYRISMYLWFVITEPKEREIFASHIKDRHLQHALIDDVVYPAVSKHFIAGNCACQQGKGTKFCIDLLVEQLRKYCRTHGHEGYVWQFDIKKFFPSTNHDVACECLRPYVDEKTAKACSDVIRSFAEIEFAKILMQHGMDKKSAHQTGHRLSTYMIYSGNFNNAIKGLTKEQASAVIERLNEGGFRGVGLGSQVTQTTQITLLNGLDHYIVETLKLEVYVRYMDDGVMAHESKEYLRYCEIKVAEFLGTIKLVLNEKSQLYPLKRGIIMLHWRIIVSIRGKVIVHKHRVKINKEKRKLTKQKKLLSNGKMSIKDVEISFLCWQAHMLEQECYGQVLRMRRFYYWLFERRAPEWNSKKRALKKEDQKILSSLPDHVQWECCVNGMLPQ